MDIESLVDNLIDATEDVAMKDPGMIGMANCETAMVDARRQLIEYVDGLEAENARLREERRWIPVEERLPENDGIYLAYLAPMGRSELAKIETHLFYFGAFRTSWRVTHWMPLPEPPEVE